MACVRNLDTLDCNNPVAGAWADVNPDFRVDRICADPEMVPWWVGSRCAKLMAAEWSTRGGRGGGGGNSRLGLLLTYDAARAEYG